MSWDCQSAEYTMKLNNSDLPQEKRRSQEIKVVCIPSSGVHPVK